MHRRGLCGELFIWVTNNTEGRRKISVGMCKARLCRTAPSACLAAACETSTMSVTYTRCFSRQPSRADCAWRENASGPDKGRRGITQLKFEPWHSTETCSDWDHRPKGAKESANEHGEHALPFKERYGSLQPMPDCGTTATCARFCYRTASRGRRRANRSRWRRTVPQARLARIRSRSLR